MLLAFRWFISFYCRLAASAILCGTIMARSHRRDSRQHQELVVQARERKKNRLQLLSSFRNKEKRKKNTCTLLRNASHRREDEMNVGGKKKWLRWPIFLLLFTGGMVCFDCLKHAAPAHSKRRISSSVKPKPNLKNNEFNEIMTSSRNDVNIWRLLSATFAWANGF